MDSLERPEKENRFGSTVIYPISNLRKRSALVWLGKTFVLSWVAFFGFFGILALGSPVEKAMSILVFIGIISIVLGLMMTIVVWVSGHPRSVVRNGGMAVITILLGIVLAFFFTI